MGEKLRLELFLWLFCTCLVSNKHWLWGRLVRPDVGTYPSLELWVARAKEQLIMEHAAGCIRWKVEPSTLRTLGTYL
jgi:hypothetical protein